MFPNPSGFGLNYGKGGGKGKMGAVPLPPQGGKGPPSQGGKVGMTKGMPSTTSLYGGAHCAGAAASGVHTKNFWSTRQANRAAKDAAMAASLEAASAADQSESEMERMGPSASALHGASRHYSRVSGTVALPPEAKALLETKSLDCQRKARLAMPLAQQAQFLEKSWKAKRHAAVENLESQIAEWQAHLKAACSEGLELENELLDVKGRIVAARTTASHQSPAQAPASMESALDMVGQLGVFFHPKLKLKLHEFRKPSMASKIVCVCMWTRPIVPSVLNSFPRGRTL